VDEKAAAQERRGGDQAAAQSNFEYEGESKDK
jgi:hypothetical protein